MKIWIKKANTPTARSPMNVILVDSQNSFDVGFLINFMVVTMSFHRDISLKLKWAQLSLASERGPVCCKRAAMM